MSSKIENIKTIYNDMFFTHLMLGHIAFLLIYQIGFTSNDSIFIFNNLIAGSILYFILKSIEYYIKKKELTKNYFISNYIITIIGVVISILLEQPIFVVIVLWCECMYFADRRYHIFEHEK